MFVYDTSAFLNGWHDHLPPATFSSVWDFINDEMNGGRILVPREVYGEMCKKDDEVARWAKARKDLFVEPSEGCSAAPERSTNCSRPPGFGTKRTRS